MTPTLPTVPDFSCSYERYDSTTLIPQNDSTYVRLIETGWTEDTFKGKSVLDIGCNSGVLSLFAHQLGASAVHAVDVTPAFVDFFSAVVDHHKLPIKVNKTGFNELNVEEHGADVVLCMEVLHWIVHQGGKLPEAVAHLASLTGETLYVETPWDIHEPSIADRDGYPVENYDIELIIRALSRHFEEVRIERFMTYFGKMNNSKRVLISATKKRKESLPIRHILDANHSGISMSRGVNPMMLITTTLGPKTLKTIPQNSAFVQLSDADMETLCTFLTTGDSASPIIAPERLGETYRQEEADGQTYMLYPFLGALGEYFPEKKTPSGAQNPMGLALGVFKHFSKAPAEVLDPLKALFDALPAFDFRKLPAQAVTALEQAGLADFLTQMREQLDGYDRALEDGLLHNDMQLGNMICTPRGRDRMVDLDLVRAGPAYADIFSTVLHTDADKASTEDCLAQAQSSASRAPTTFDVAFSVGSSLLWLRARMDREEALREQAFARYTNGLVLLRDLSKTL